jgi:hypothetical protein
MDYLKSIYNYFLSYEEQIIVEIRHGGNQMIDEFYMKKENGRPDYNKGKTMTLHIGKSKTILDVKKEIKIQRTDGTYLSHTGQDGKSNINLREEIFGPTLKNTCPLKILEKENEVIKLYIQIPGW